MQQVHNRGNLDLDEDDYFAIIGGKTAELTAVCCRLGAHYAGAAEATVEALEGYGRDLGVAFQIADDVLDIWGEERTTGKTLGTDLEKQKLTLPLIRLLATAPPGPPTASAAGWPTPDADRRRELRPYLEASGALDYAWDAPEHARRGPSPPSMSSPNPNAKAVLRFLAALVVGTSTSGRRFPRKSPTRGKVRNFAPGSDRLGRFVAGLGRKRVLFLPGDVLDDCGA